MVTRAPAQVLMQKMHNRLCKAQHLIFSANCYSSSPHNRLQKKTKTSAGKRPRPHQQQQKQHKPMANCPARAISLNMVWDAVVRKNSRWVPQKRDLRATVLQRRVWQDLKTAVYAEPPTYHFGTGFSPRQPTFVPEPEPEPEPVADQHDDDDDNDDERAEQAGGESTPSFCLRDVAAPEGIPSEDRNPAGQLPLLWGLEDWSTDSSSKEQEDHELLLDLEAHVFHGCQGFHLPADLFGLGGLSEVGVSA